MGVKVLDADVIDRGGGVTAEEFNAIVGIIPDLADRLFSVVDATGVEWAWIDQLTGAFHTATTGNIDAIIAGMLSSGIGVAIPYQSGYVVAFVDASANFLFGVDNAGDFWLFDTNVSLFFRNGGISAGLTAALYPTADVRGYGDSMFENWASYSATLQASLTALGDTKSRNISASGLGGQTGAQILARSGARLAYVTFPLDANGIPEIPASGPATVTVSEQLLNHPGSGNVEQIDLSVTLQVGAGIAGTLSRLAGGTTYQFTRSVAGSAIKVPTKVAIKPNNEAQRLKINSVWVGSNDLVGGASAATIFALIDDAVQRGQDTLYRRATIRMPTHIMGTNDVSRLATYATLWDMVLPKYGDIATDTLGVIRAAYILANPTPTGNDAIDFAAGLVPRSWMAGDRQHYLNGGFAYGALADAEAATYYRKGW